MTLQTVPGRHRSAQSFSVFAELTSVLGQAGLSGARVAATVGVAGGLMAAGSAIPANAAPVKAGEHDAIVAAMEEVIKNGPRTPDLGGTANTTQVGEAIAAMVAQRKK